MEEDIFKQVEGPITGAYIDKISDISCLQPETFERVKYSETDPSFEEDKSIIVCPFDRYEVKVKLDANGRFQGIVGINVQRDFLSTLQRLEHIRSIGYLDLSEKYPEEPEEE